MNCGCHLIKSGSVENTARNKVNNRKKKMWIIAGIKRCKLPISDLCTTTHNQSEGIQKGEVTNYNVQYQEKPLMFTGTANWET